MADGYAITLMAGGAGAPRRVDAAVGSVVVVGSCSCAECDVDLVLAALPGAWFRGLITIDEEHWALDNLSVDAWAWVIDLEDPESRVVAPPGRRKLVSPFEFAGLSFGIGPCEASELVTVIGQEPQLADNNACASSVAPLADAAFQPGTAHHAVLEELSRGFADDGVAPSAAVLASRLRRRGWALTPKAVESHVDYLFQRCFPGETGRGRGWKRTALVSLATRRPDHVRDLMLQGVVKGD